MSELIAKTAVVATTRAPRGSKILAKAFLSAAEGIPEGRRADAVKAALSLIRDELKDARDQAKRVKQQRKIKPFKPPVAQRTKSVESAPQQANVLQAQKSAAARVGGTQKKNAAQKVAAEKTVE
jgi:hypothetical protein